MKKVSTLILAFIFLVCPYSVFAERTQKSTPQNSGLTERQEKIITEAVRNVKDRHASAIHSGVARVHRELGLPGNLQYWERVATAVSAVESSGKHKAESSKGALGLMQLMPVTAQDVCKVGSNQLFDPKINVYCGMSLIKKLRESSTKTPSESWDWVWMAYNRGETGAELHLERSCGKCSPLATQRLLASDSFVLSIRFAISLLNNQA